MENTMFKFGLKWDQYNYLSRIPCQFDLEFWQKKMLLQVVFCKTQIRLSKVFCLQKIIKYIFKVTSQYAISSDCLVLMFGSVLIPKVVVILITV